MRRRTFLAAAAAGPSLAPSLTHAQPVPPLIGVLRVNAAASEPFVGVFRRDMARLGLEEGKGYRMRVLFADGDSARLPALAADLVAGGARLIVAFGNAGVAAAQQATRTIPIVGMADDLAGSGLVASMARPGGNTTGVSIMGFELDAKRLELLHEIVPAARRLGVFVDSAARSGGRAHVEEAANKLGLQLAFLPANRPEDLQPAMARLHEAKVDAVLFLPSPFLQGERAWFIQRMRESRLPAMYEWPESVEEGGLMSYAPRITLCFRHVAVQVAKILRGAKPADLPVEQPSLFTLALNAGTARTIGLQIPEAMLLRADLVVD
jgi:putative ABC transport system substrate-binding protein